MPDYIGSAMSLIASTFSVEIRHSEAAPKASEAATALISRDDATGAGRQTKPAARGDRIMVQFLDLSRANHPRSADIIAARTGKIAAATRAYPGKTVAALTVSPFSPVFIPTVHEKLRCLGSKSNLLWAGFCPQPPSNPSKKLSVVVPRGGSEIVIIINRATKHLSVGLGLQGAYSLELTHVRHKSGRGRSEGARKIRLDVQSAPILSRKAAYIEPIVAVLNLIVLYLRVRKLLLNVAFQAPVEFCVFVFQEYLLPGHMRACVITLSIDRLPT